MRWKNRNRKSRPDLRKKRDGRIYHVDEKGNGKTISFCLLKSVINGFEDCERREWMADVVNYLLLFKNRRSGARILAFASLGV